jgi:hypothetical protein
MTPTTEVQMSRLLLAAALLSTAGCASGGGSGTAVAPAGPTTQTLSVAGGGEMRISAGGSGPVSHRLEATADRVWRVMPAAFDSLGVPVTRLDAAQKVIGNEGFKIRQRLKNVNLSRYLDCGQTQIGPNADSYEVFMTLLVQVVPVANATGASNLVTTFEASARPLTFSQGYSRCTTNATLERQLLAAVQAQLK